MNLLSKFTFSFSLLFVGLLLLQSELTAQISIEHFTTQNTGANTLDDKDVRSIIVAKDGTTWGISANTVFSLSDGFFTTYPELGVIRKIFQDSQDRIWFIGQISWLYENNEWTLSTYADGGAYVAGYCISEDFEKNIWVGAGDYYFKYDNEKWERYYVYEKNGETLILSILRHIDGSIFFGKEWYMVKRFEDTYEEPIELSMIHALTVDQNHKIYAGSREGVHTFDGTDWQTIGFGNFQEDDYPAVYDIKIDNENNPLIGTEKGLFQVNGTQQITIREPEQDYAVFEIFPNDEKLYLATNNGIRIYSKETNSWTSYSTTDGLTDNGIMGFYQDETQTYVLTRNGCSIYEDGKWTSFKQNGAIKKIAFDNQGHAWAIDGIGIKKYNGENWTNPSLEEGFFPDFGNYAENVLVDYLGHVWIVGSQSLIRYNGEAWEKITDDLVYNSNIKKILFEDSKHRIWVVGYDFARYFDGEQWMNFDYQTTGIDIGAITAIAEDQSGNIWMTTRFGNGLLKFDGNSWSALLIGNDSYGNIAYDMAFDQNGYLWIAGGDYISKFDGENFTYYTTEDELSSDNIYSISVDYLNRKWLGTSNGVYVLTDEATSINSVSEITISLYPNPSNNTVYLQSTPSQIIQSIRLLDTQGRQLTHYGSIYQQNFTLEVADYPKGLYFVEVKTSKGKLIKRLVLN